MRAGPIELFRRFVASPLEKLRKALAVIWPLGSRSDGTKIRSRSPGPDTRSPPSPAPEALAPQRRDDGAPAASPARSPADAAVAISAPTFGDAVEQFIHHRASVKSWKKGADGAEAKAYRRTLLNSPLASVPVAAVATADVLAALGSMPAVTAEKTRTRIACVLDWAKAMGYREGGENVARRRGHMEFLLSAVPAAKHHAALAWSEVPALMRELQMTGSSAAKALQWTILTAARTSETLGATRREIRSAKEYSRIANVPIHLIHGDIWVVPAERMKEGREHHVPLTKDALALIGDRRGRLFPGYNGQMMQLLSKLRPGYTVHGLRSSFTDWAAENDYPQELREMALAHAVGDSVERAYRHSTRLNKRREMMEAWAHYVLGKSAIRRPADRLEAPARYSSPVEAKASFR